MDGEQGPTDDGLDGVWPLMEQAASLDVFLDQLGNERRPCCGGRRRGRWPCV